MSCVYADRDGRSAADAWAGEVLCMRVQSSSKDLSVVRVAHVREDNWFVQALLFISTFLMMLPVLPFAMLALVCAFIFFALCASICLVLLLLLITGCGLAEGLTRLGMLLYKSCRRGPKHQDGAERAIQMC